MTGAEAAGEIVTGALVAGAVEGRSGVRLSGDHTHGLCLNCGTGLIGSYCHRCGQPEHIHRSLSGIWHDIAHGVLHFEGKMWRTLPLLAWRPGELTRRYIHGERARFVSPMALFLFSVFLMFAIFSASGAQFAVPENKPPTEMAKDAARSQIPRLEAELAKLREQQKSGGASGPALEQRIDRIEDEIDDLNDVANWKPERLTGIKSGWPRLDQGILKAQENPNLLLYKLQSNAYKFSWALIPLSVPFVWLLYAWHRKYRVYDHAVFVTYSLAFMSLLVIVLTIASNLGVGTEAIAIAGTFVPPIHVYRQLRGAYGTRRRWAILRMFMLVMFSGFILSIFFVMLMTMGVLG